MNTYIKKRQDLVCRLLTSEDELQLILIKEEIKQLDHEQLQRITVKQELLNK